MNAHSGDSAPWTRRDFLSASGLALGSAGLLAASGAIAAEKPEKPQSAKLRISKKHTVLFQGDSITDAGRSREKAANANDQAGLGSGYASMAAVGLLLDHPDYDLKVYNRGISGNKVFQLADRWADDCVKLQPNVVSILIGVNDFWHTLSSGYKGTIETYEKDYRALIERTLTELPGVSLAICEPFVLRCGAVNDRWFPDFDKYRKVSRTLAEEYRARFVAFQLMFDRAVKYAPAEYWAKDGVHPTAAGSALMAHTWLNVVLSKRG